MAVNGLSCRFYRGLSPKLPKVHVRDSHALMKAISLLILFFISASSWGKDLQLCNDPSLRLLLQKPLCLKPQNDNPLNYDMPGLKLDYSDLENILRGAESGGGRVVDPSFRVRTYFAKQYYCEAKLLADGGKAYSWLGETSFYLSSLRDVQIKKEDWSFGIIKGNSIHSKMTPVSIIPNIEMNFSVEINEQDLIVCQKTDKKTSHCSQSSIGRAHAETNLLILKDQNKGMQKNRVRLNISCSLD